MASLQSALNGCPSVMLLWDVLQDPMPGQMKEPAAIIVSLVIAAAGGLAKSQQAYWGLAPARRKPYQSLRVVQSGSVCSPGGSNQPINLEHWVTRSRPKHLSVLGTQVKARSSVLPIPLCTDHASGCDTKFLHLQCLQPSRQQPRAASCLLQRQLVHIFRFWVTRVEKGHVSAYHQIHLQS